VLDLCAEFRRATSGLTVACGRSLLARIIHASYCAMGLRVV